MRKKIVVLASLVLFFTLLFSRMIHAEGMVIPSDENVLCYHGGRWQPAAVQPSNPGWDSFIQLPYAKWIWRTSPLTFDDAVDGVSYAFQRKFFIPKCAKNIRAEIEVTGDNFFSLKINGQFAGSDPVWTSLKQYRVGSFLKTGTNTLSFTVENTKDNSGTPSTNPAGLIFLLKILWEGCEQSITLAE